MGNGGGGGSTSGGCWAGIVEHAKNAAKITGIHGLNQMEETIDFIGVR